MIFANENTFHFLAEMTERTLSVSPSTKMRANIRTVSSSATSQSNKYAHRLNFTIFIVDISP